MNIVPSITAVLFGAKRRRVSRQTTLLGGEFARKCKGERTADVRFAALAARYEDRTKPTTSLTASMVWRANFCARPAPSPKNAVNGMPYTLYSDGSIEAQLPEGTLRFGSITELRNHIEQSA